MKFLKGVMLGTIVATGVTMMYTDSGKDMKKKMMKQGKKFLKVMGM